MRVQGEGLRVRVKGSSFRLTIIFELKRLDVPIARVSSASIRAAFGWILSCENLLRGWGLMMLIDSRLVTSHEERRCLFWDRLRVVHHRVYFSIRRLAFALPRSSRAAFGWILSCENLRRAAGLDQRHSSSVVN